MTLEEYKKEVENDVLEYAAEMTGYCDSIEKFRDDAFLSDSVTGNASGSYYCNAWKAQEAIGGLIWSEELLDIFREFGEDKIPVEKGPEYIDVTIRCYLVDQVISENEEEIKEILGISEE